MVEAYGSAVIKLRWYGWAKKISWESSLLSMAMTLVLLTPHFTNFWLRSKRVALYLQNIQFMESLLLAQRTWVLVKDNQFSASSLIFLKKVQMRRSWRSKQRNMDFKLEELVESIHPWIAKEQLTFLRWLVSELLKPMSLKNFILA